MVVCPVCRATNPDGVKNCRQCGANLSVIPTPVVPLFLPVGTKLKGGTYTVGKVLGQGGFGITYKGSDVRLQRPVAIKEFFPQGCVRRGSIVVPSTPATFTQSDFEAMKQRFLQEARTLARFRHPGIVQVYDVFEENGTAYIVMEFLRGKPLSKILEEKGVLDEQEALGYILKVCDALEVVHQAGVLHRDIKPDNIFVCEDGNVVLIDFGAAREFSARKTQRHTAILTPGYAPLEQYAELAQRGAYTDIYALAATLYHLLTGEIPVPAPDRRMGMELPDVRQLNPRVSPSVAQAVMKGLEMRADQRPQSVREFRDLLISRMTPSRPQPVTPAASVSAATTPAPSSPQELQIDEALKSVLARLWGLTEKVRQEDMVIDHLYINTLEKNVRQRFSCRLEQGNLYLIVSTGDEINITDLDARIYSPSGEVLAEDTLKDNVPVLRFQAPASGNYTVEVWAYEMQGDGGFCALTTGHKITSSAERRVLDVWEGIFERFLAITLFCANAGYECLHAELDTVGERFTRTLGMELEGGYEYLIVGAGDEVHVADLDMEVALPDGRTLEDKGKDNVPKVMFSLNRTGKVAIKLIAAQMHKGYEKGYYALFVGRRR